MNIEIHTVLGIEVNYSETRVSKESYLEEELCFFLWVMTQQSLGSACESLNCVSGTVLPKKDSVEEQLKWYTEKIEGDRDLGYSDGLGNAHDFWKGNFDICGYLFQIKTIHEHARITMRTFVELNGKTILIAI